jgi:hypothetical protein
MRIDTRESTRARNGSIAERRADRSIGVGGTNRTYFTLLAYAPFPVAEASIRAGGQFTPLDLGLVSSRVK